MAPVIWGYTSPMEFKTVRADHDLGARIEDVAQEAIDATALTFAHDAGIDVEDLLRAQLASRAIAAADDQTLAEATREIRAGRPPSVGRSDGSVAARRALAEAAPSTTSDTWVSRLLRTLHLRR